MTLNEISISQELDKLMEKLINGTSYILANKTVVFRLISHDIPLHDDLKIFFPNSSNIIKYHST